MSQFMVMKVDFQRTKESRWEEGIGIGLDIGDLDNIIDSKGKIVTEVWDFRGTWTEGLIIFDVKKNSAMNTKLDNFKKVQKKHGI